MITYHNRTHMTAVPTELLQDTHLSTRTFLLRQKASPQSSTPLAMKALSCRS